MSVPQPFAGFAKAGVVHTTLIVVPAPANATTGNVVVTASGVPLSAGSFTVNFSTPSTAIEYSYDANGRVVQTMTCTPMNCGIGQGFLMTYAYDLSGDLTTLTSNGTSIQYSPADSPIDGMGQVTKVESGWVDAQHPTTLATINSVSGYSPSGALQNITYGNGVTESRVYNHQIQPCRINVNSSGQLLSTCADALPSGNIQDFNISYNGTNDNGNVAGFVASGQQNFNRSYTYDSLNRIQTMSAPGDVCSGLSWTIDPWGNRTAQTVTGGSCFSGSTAVNSNNRVIGDQYDAAGNLVNDGNHTYTYDAENRIMQVDGGNTAKYVYDGLGKRVEKTSGSDQQYLYDASGQINTVFGNGAFQRMYVYLEGKAFAEYFNNTTYFINADHLGSTRLLTGMDKSVQESDDYYPYGETITAGTNDSLKFTGKERDSESGLDMFGARYYASTMGRFMTPDWSSYPVPVPYAYLGDPQTLNLYSYVENSPLNEIDPNGHCDIDIGGGKKEHHWGWCVFHALGFYETSKERQDRIENERQQILAGHHPDGSPLTPAEIVRIQRASQTKVDEYYKDLQDQAQQYLQALASANEMLSPWDRIPVRDQTGRIHTDLPDHVPDAWTKDDMEFATEELRESIKERAKDAGRFGGPDEGHMFRIRQEQQLLREIEGKLGSGGK